MNGCECNYCKVGYPRPIWEAADLARGVMVRLNDESQRYEYRTEKKEDERLSPYVPLWSLAWGANMNIQFCTAAGFLGYISKYVPKPEPSGLVEDTPEMREREGRDGRQVRYLNARKVGAPECVFDLFQYAMKAGETIIPDDAAAVAAPPLPESATAWAHRRRGQRGHRGRGARRR